MAGGPTRFMGDGFKAVFGLDVAHEDDAERAVRAGLALIEAAKFVDCVLMADGEAIIKKWRFIPK